MGLFLQSLHAFCGVTLKTETVFDQGNLSAMR